MKSNKEFWQELWELIKDRDFLSITIEHLLAIAITVLVYTNIIIWLVVIIGSLF